MSLTLLSGSVEPFNVVVRTSKPCLLFLGHVLVDVWRHDDIRGITYMDSPEVPSQARAPDMDCIHDRRLAHIFQLDRVSGYNFAPDYSYRRMPDAAYPTMGYNSSQLYLFRVLIYVLSELQHICVWLAKATFIAIFYDIIKTVPGQMRYMLHAITFFTVSTFIVTTLTYLIPCYGSKHECFKGIKIYLPVNYVCNILTDIAIMVFPVYLLKLLNMPRRERFAVWFIVAVGSISPIVATIKFGSMYDTLLRMTPHGRDYNMIVSAMNVIEIVFAIIAACLPSFRVFFRSINGSTAKNSNEGSGYSGNSSQLRWIRSHMSSKNTRGTSDHESDLQLHGSHQS
ncbi:hypothetical protein EDC01DRAFT_631739 [Geopyxis carbonaria]|nr:hypothetical protein EDC01DRAFT_631739 [Geopyxis carbonaria]